MQTLLNLSKLLKVIPPGAFVEIWAKLQAFAATDSVEEKTEIAVTIADILADATESELDDDIAKFILRILDDPFVEKLFDQWFESEEEEAEEEKPEEDENDFPVLDDEEEPEED